MIVDLQHYALFLLITFVFILLTLRAFFYAMIQKVDPMKAVTPSWQWKIINFWQKKKSKKTLEVYS